MSENIGIMSKAFFTGKAELLSWLNDFFKAGYTKVEQVCTGAIHCQILDSIYPGEVPLHKVNFNAKFDYEYVNNYKVLQKVFDKQQVKKHVDVAKLIKGKYQDNLEFLQWMKHFHEVKYGGQEYDAEARRKEAIARYNKGRKIAPSASGSEQKSAPSSGSSRVTAPRARPAASTAAAPRAAKKTSSASGASGDSKQSAKVEELNERLAKLRSTIEGLEKERNFYFGKLREIEVMCQDPETEDVDAGTKAKVLEILYKTDDNEEFEAPAEEAGADDDVAAEDEAADENEEAEEEENLTL